jgi:hypothetical protein
MSQLFSNNAVSTLASGISAVATSLTVQAADGLLFPDPTTPDFFLATLQDSSNNIEIVRVTAKSTDTFTIERAQEGTAARAWLAGDIVELRITSGTLAQYRQGVGDQVTDVAISTALGLANAHDFINCTAALTITLPDAATVAAGWQVTIRNSVSAGGGVVTVTRVTGGDLMDGVAADITIPEGGTAYISVNENENGFISMHNKAATAWPVGSIFIATVATSPETLLGFGTWTRIAEGRMLIGEGTGDGLTTRTAAATGGQEDAVLPTHTHTLNDPGHTHQVVGTANDSGGGGASGNFAGNTGLALSNTTGITINDAGEDPIDKNMPPYLVVYMWERTA